MNVTARRETEVLIIGAGPAGSLASVLLHNAGIQPLVVERQTFPRFSIGESLLPQLMVFLEGAGMAGIVHAAGYQPKDGAAFSRGGSSSAFDFRDKSSTGPSRTYQVKRAEFDKLLADHAASLGVDIRYRQEVLSVQDAGEHYRVTVRDDQGSETEIEAGFILDASGFGRVLPRLLDLDRPSDFPPRRSIFCHFRDNLDSREFDRDKILICIHPQIAEVWYWLIPFSDGTCSVGVVGPERFFDTLSGEPSEKLLNCLRAEPRLAELLVDAEISSRVGEIAGYASNVSTLYGDKFALLGNAGEFLDPVFSSGVTIALKSADLAAGLLIREARGERVSWEQDYARELKSGVDTFRAFVEAWYDGSLHDIIFFDGDNKGIRESICAILAGYAWDQSNPFVHNTPRRLQVLAELCRR